MNDYLYLKAVWSSSCRYRVKKPFQPNARTLFFYSRHIYLRQLNKPNFHAWRFYSASRPDDVVCVALKKTLLSHLSAYPSAHISAADNRQQLVNPPVW